MAGLVMQSLGCEVAALNTVQFSTSATDVMDSGVADWALQVII